MSNLVEGGGKVPSSGEIDRYIYIYIYREREREYIRSNQRMMTKGASK